MQSMHMLHRDYKQSLSVLLYGVLACVYKLVTIISVIFITSCCDNTGSVLQTHAGTLGLCNLGLQLVCLQINANSDGWNMELWGGSGV